jgi:hypothetical protein
MPSPWWVVEMAASPDNYTAALHQHLDHVFAGLQVAGAGAAQTRVRWIGERELAEAHGIPEDVRPAARGLFAEIGQKSASCTGASSAPVAAGRGATPARASRSRRVAHR